MSQAPSDADLLRLAERAVSSLRIMNPTEREDARQEAALRIWRHITNGGEQSPQLLVTVGKRAIIDAYRSRYGRHYDKRRRDVPLPEFVNDVFAIDESDDRYNELVVKIEQALNRSRLPLRTKWCVYQALIEERPQQELADALGLTASRVSQLIDDFKTYMRNQEAA